jgi:hypothetical protein
MVSFNRTLEKAFALEAQIQDAAKNGKIPAKARWMEVHWNRVKLYELLTDSIPALTPQQVHVVNKIVQRVRNLENVLDPSADHFTERML